MNVRFLLKKEWLLTLGAIGFVLATGVLFYITRPTTLTVAAAPRGGAEVKLIEAYARALAEERKGVRLRVVVYDDVRQSAEVLQQGRADLAVIRPDALLPVNGLTIAILREEGALLIAPTANKIAEMADLAKRRLGIVVRHDADPKFFATILAHYDLAPPNVTLVTLALEEVEAALAAKRVDAVAVVAAPTGAVATAVVRAAEKVSNRKITVIPVSEAEALTERDPALTAVTLPAGALGGRPKQPAEETKTVGVSYRLAARSKVDRVNVSEVTQYLFQMRSRLAQATSAVNMMRAPDTDTSTSATLPVHPGAVDYFNREQLTFMDRYGDWLWLALFSMGGVSSAFAWLMQRFAKKRRELVDVVLDRLTGMLTEAREATSISALDKLALEIDRLVARAVRYARHRTTGTRTMSALILAIDSARAAVADRRRQLLDQRGQPEVEDSAPMIAAVRSAAE